MAEQTTGYTIDAPDGTQTPITRGEIDEFFIWNPEADAGKGLYTFDPKYQARSGDPNKPMDQPAWDAAYAKYQHTGFNGTAEQRGPYTPNGTPPTAESAPQPSISNTIESHPAAAQVVAVTLRTAEGVDVPVRSPDQTLPIPESVTVLHANGHLWSLHRIGEFGEDAWHSLVHVILHALHRE
jgi:hypothetical protein